jgi:hypothetical protein
VAIIDASVAHARDAARSAPTRDRRIWVARLRKLEALAAWVSVAD